MGGACVKQFSRNERKNKKTKNSCSSPLNFFFSFSLSPPLSLKPSPFLHSQMDSSVSSPVFHEAAADPAAAAPLPTALLADATATTPPPPTTTATTSTTAATATTTTTANGLPIPRGLQEALRGLAREALRHQPEDVLEFSRWCVRVLLSERDSERETNETSWTFESNFDLFFHLPISLSLSKPKKRNSYFADVQAAERAHREAQMEREAAAAVISVAAAAGGGSEGGSSGEGEEGEAAAAVAALASAKAPLDADDAALLASCCEENASLDVDIDDENRQQQLPRDGDDASGALRAMILGEGEGKGENGGGGGGGGGGGRRAAPLLALATAFAAE